MNRTEIENLAQMAMRAAIEVIDAAIPGTKRSNGPLGDELAAKLDYLIIELVTRHYFDAA